MQTVLYSYVTYPLLKATPANVKQRVDFKRLPQSCVFVCVALAGAHTQQAPLPVNASVLWVL